MDTQTFLKNFKHRNNIPEFLGSFDSLLSTGLKSYNSEFDFISGLNSGDTMGYERGLNEAKEETLKNFITSGSDKYLITNNNDKVYGYNNNDDLFNNKDTLSAVEKIVKQKYDNEISIMKNEYEPFLENNKKDFYAKYQDSYNKNQKGESIEDYIKQKYFPLQINQNKTLGLSEMLKEAESQKQNLQQSPVKNKNKIKSNGTKASKLSEVIDDIGKLNEFNRLKSLGNIIPQTEQQAQKLTRTDIKNEFKMIKFDSPIFLSDELHIYDVEGIRKKILGKNTISTLEEKIQKTLKVTDLSDIVNDLRSIKPKNQKNLHDFIIIPNSTKFHTVDSYIDKKYSGNVPENVNQFVLALRNNKNF